MSGNSKFESIFDQSGRDLRMGGIDSTRHMIISKLHHLAIGCDIAKLLGMSQEDLKRFSNTAHMLLQTHIQNAREQAESGQKRMIIQGIPNSLALIEILNYIKTQYTAINAGNIDSATGNFSEAIANELSNGNAKALQIRLPSQQISSDTYNCLRSAKPEGDRAGIMVASLEKPERIYIERLGNGDIFGTVENENWCCATTSICAEDTICSVTTYGDEVEMAVLREIKADNSKGKTKGELSHAIVTYTGKRNSTNLTMSNFALINFTGEGNLVDTIPVGYGLLDPNGNLLTGLYQTTFETRTPRQNIIYEKFFRYSDLEKQYGTSVNFPNRKNSNFNGLKIGQLFADKFEVGQDGCFQTNLLREGLLGPTKALSIKLPTQVNLPINIHDKGSLSDDPRQFDTLIDFTRAIEPKFDGI